MLLQMEVVLYINYVNRKEAESDGNGSDHANEPEKRPPQWLQTRLCHLPRAGGGGSILNACFSFFLLI